MRILWRNVTWELEPAHEHFAPESVVSAWSTGGEVLQAHEIRTLLAAAETGEAEAAFQYHRQHECSTPVCATQSFEPASVVTVSTPVPIDPSQKAASPAAATRTASCTPVARGLYFEDFTHGDMHASGGRTVTEADIVAFAGLSGDFNPLHTNQQHAERTIFRGRVAHGLLVHSIASGLANQMGIFDGTIVALQEMLIRYEAPVRPGDTIHVQLTVLECDPAPARKRGAVRFRVQVLNQDEVSVNDGEWLTMLARRLPARG